MISHAEIFFQKDLLVRKRDLKKSIFIIIVRIKINRCNLEHLLLQNWFPQNYKTIDRMEIEAEGLYCQNKLKLGVIRGVTWSY